jgi:hypothetical protein
MYMRRKCQECRLKKCLSVGMRPECKEAFATFLLLKNIITCNPQLEIVFAMLQLLIFIRCDCTLEDTFIPPTH